MKYRGHIAGWVAGIFSFFLFSGQALAAPVVSLTGNGQNPVQITLGDSVNIAWTISGAKSCQASDSTGYSDTWQTTSGSLTVTPAQVGSVFYYLECWDTAGVSSGKKSLYVATGPTVSFSASPTTITAGQTVTLSWNSGGDTCAVGDSQKDFGLKAGSGSLTVTPTTSTKYSITCYVGSWPPSSPGTTREASVTVNAAPPGPGPQPGAVCGNGVPETGEGCDMGPQNGACPATCGSNCAINDCSTQPKIVSFTADRTSLQNPDFVTISWQIQNVTSCITSGAWGFKNGPLPPSGSSLQYVSVGSNVYTMECFNDAAVSSGKSTVTVTVGGAGGGGGGTCVPNSSCATYTCTGQTCSDGCGGQVAGTKTCNGGGPVTPPPGGGGNTACGNGVMNTGEACDNGTSNGICPSTCSTSCTINNCNPAGNLPPAQNPGPGGGPAAGLPPQGQDLGIFFNPLKFGTIEGTLGSAMSTLQGIVVILAIIFIIIGALLYITASGSEGQISKAKGAITAAIIGLALAIAAPAFLKEIAQVLGWTAVDPALQSVNTLTSIAGKVLDFLLSIIGILAIIMLVIGGIMYLTSAGDEGRAETGKKIVKYSVIAIVVALSALVIIAQIAKFFA